VSQDAQCLALVVFFLQPAQAFLSLGMIPKESDGRFGKGPLEMGIADFTP
jgi:hypothetical protein